MRELSEQLRRWHAEGRRYAVASVVGVTGSAPRSPGAALAVDEAGTVVGSISGGCVEGAVYELCREALRTGRPRRETFGYSDSDAFAVGLTCGGVLDVFVHPVTPPVGAVVERALRTPGAVALVRDMASGAVLAVGPDWAEAAESDRGRSAQDAPMIGHRGRSVDPGKAAGKAEPDVVRGVRRVGPRAIESVEAGAGSTDPVAVADPRVVAEARAMLESGATGVREIGCGASAVTVFVESWVPPPRMIVVGAIDFAGAVARIGKFLGYRVTVVDARPVFATPARFPEADEVVVDWPHRYLARAEVDSRTVVCVLTHDAKFDIPVLEVALRRAVGYVGAMGSRRTHRDRLARLRAAGLTEIELAQLHSPIGLDLGGHTPEETAVAVAAEIVAVRRGGSGRALAATDGPIHHFTDAEAVGPPPMGAAGR
ncbi:XdhC family protein [Nocardia blacklockiae]|uniref:XdhC family protein n=1 Tax=Nocardia blacklockiae TaxID=480036 RepID=UPI002B4B1FFE|nr:XdhC family protein [Nocardia blacklockiae]